MTSRYLWCLRCPLTAATPLAPQYVCDPVMGDHGKLYVPEDLVAVYRDEMTSVATTMTPNQFEAELLTGIKIQGEHDASRACHALHEKGVTTVIITSLEYPALEGSSSGSPNLL